MSEKMLCPKFTHSENCISYLVSHKTKVIKMWTCTLVFTLRRHNIQFHSSDNSVTLEIGQGHWIMYEPIASGADQDHAKF